MIASDKYQNWKFFQPSAVTVNSQTLSRKKLSPTVLSPIRPSGTILSQTGGSIMLSNYNKSQMSEATFNEFKVSKKKPKTFIDHILDAAKNTQENELKEFFMTQVQSESILPPIQLSDNTEYKSLLTRQSQIPYLVSKHVRLASERNKFGKLENNHYQHYEKQDPLDSVMIKAKPSEKTLTYRPKKQEEIKAVRKEKLTNLLFIVFRLNEITEQAAIKRSKYNQKYRIDFRFNLRCLLNVWYELR